MSCGESQSSIAAASSRVCRVRVVKQDVQRRIIPNHGSICSDPLSLPPSLKNSNRRRFGVSFNFDTTTGSFAQHFSTFRSLTHPFQQEIIQSRFNFKPQTLHNGGLIPTKLKPSFGVVCVETERPLQLVVGGGVSRAEK